MISLLLSFCSGLLIVVVSINSSLGIVTCLVITHVEDAASNSSIARWGVCAGDVQAHSLHQLVQEHHTCAQLGALSIDSRPARCSAPGKPGLACHILKVPSMIMHQTCQCLSQCTSAEQCPNAQHTLALSCAQCLQTTER